jgi:hypothetical protein
MSTNEVSATPHSSGFGETFAGWCALAAILLFFLAMGPGFRFLPPLSPSLSAEQFAQHFRDHAVSVRIGSILMMTGAALLFPMFGAMSAAMVRMKGRPDALAWTQLATAIVTFAPLFMCSFFFAAASFRPERGAEDVLAINDLGWFFLVMPTPAALIQLVVFGIAILGDDKQRPVFPRWLAYFSFWVGILFFAGVFIPLFKTGPFAWNGLLAFWVPLAVFGIWTPVMAWAFIRRGGQISRGERD